MFRILYKEEGKDSFVNISASMTEAESDKDWLWLQDQLQPKVYDVALYCSPWIMEMGKNICINAIC